MDGCVVPRGFESGTIWSARRLRVDNQDDETGFEYSRYHPTVLAAIVYELQFPDTRTYNAVDC